MSVIFLFSSMLIKGYLGHMSMHDTENHSKFLEILNQNFHYF